MDPEALSGAAQQPGVDARGGQGIQINQGGINLQVNVLAAGEQRAAEQGVTAEEFRADVLDMLASLDDAACRGQLPAYLPAGADVTRMTRTVRLLGSVRRSPKEEAAEPAPGQPVTGADRDRLYLLPAERDVRAAQPPQPWDEIAAACERLVVLADPGMGKSWLMRTETHRLAQAAAESLRRSATVGPDVVIPLPIRADVLASSPGRTLAEAVSGYLVEEGMLAARSRGPMRERIDRGGVMLLIDALDEVPADTATSGAPAPRKRLDDRLRHWAASSPGAARFVLTTRLAGYSGPPVPQAHEIELLPFTADDARAAIQAWDLAGPAAARVSGLLAVPALAALTRIPLLLALVCSLAADPPDQQVLPQTRAGLYEAVVWQFLSGAHRSADPGARASAIRPADRQSLLRVLTRIAMAFAVTDRGWIDRMPYPEIAAAIRGAQDAADDGPASAVLTRLADEIGILVPAGNPAVREQPYLFLHRTIAEYLVARHLRDLPQPERMSIVESHQWFDPDWAEVIPMLGGLLAIEQPGQARALVAHFLSQRPDPLHRAFHAALRVLGETPDPDQLLTSAQADELGQRTRGLLAAGTTRATRERLIRVLLAAPAWPRAVTDALLDSIGRDLLERGYASVSPILVALSHGVAESLRVRLTEQGEWSRLEPGVQDPTEALLTRLADDQSVRRQTLRALAGRVDAGVTEALIGCLADRYQPVREAAVEALASRPGLGVTQALIGCFADDDWSVRRAAAGAMAGRNDVGVTEALLGCLGDERSGVRVAALEALAGRRHAGLTQALLGCVADDDWLVRQAAVRALAGRVDAGVTEALIGRLTDTLGPVAEAAVNGLVGRRDPGVTDALLGCLADTDDEVRWVAVRALADRVDVSVTEALLGCLADRYPLVRMAAIRALAERDDAGVTEALLACFADEGYDVRRTAVQVLAGRQGPGVAEALLGRAADQDFDVRLSVVQALAGHQEPGVVAALLRVAGQDRDMRRWAIEVLADRREPEVTRALIRYLGDRDATVRIAAIKALAGRDDDGVTQALLGCLTARGWGVRDAAFDVLAGRDDPRILVWLCQRRHLLSSSSTTRNKRFDLADAIADRVYLMMPPAARPRIRQRLGQMTRRLRS